MAIQTYDPAQNIFSIAGINVTGFGPGTMIKVSRNEDAFTLTVGADGRAARTKNANRSGKFEVTLLGSSPSNDMLQALAILDELSGAGVGAALVKDGTGTAKAAAENAWIMKIPDLERAKELGEVTWIIETDSVALGQGGTTAV